MSSLLYSIFIFFFVQLYDLFLFWQLIVLFRTLLGLMLLSLSVTMSAWMTKSFIPSNTATRSCTASK